MRGVLAAAVLAIVGLSVLRNPVFPFARLLHSNPSVVHINSGSQATSYVARLNPNDTQITCLAGTNGWTYMCSRTDPNLGPMRTALYVQAGVVRDSRTFSNSTITAPEPRSASANTWRRHNQPATSAEPTSKGSPMICSSTRSSPGLRLPKGSSTRTPTTSGSTATYPDPD
jgi:hypothetical protein